MSERDRRWGYDRGARRYRDLTSGRFLSRASIIEARDLFVSRQTDIARRLATAVADGSISPVQWEQSMRTVVKHVNGAQFIFGRGGLNAMNQSAWGQLGNIVKSEYKYLKSFAADVAAGRLSEAQIGARSALYLDTSVKSFETGNAASYSLHLDQIPGDGQTRCLGRCACHLVISEDDEAWTVYWRLGKADHCEDCVAMSAEWNPLLVQKAA